MIHSTLGSRIEQARDAKQYSARQLARRIGVKPETLENWERDRSEPRAEKLLKLAGILQVPMVWLLTGDTPEAYEHPVNPTLTSEIVQKLDRATALQRELTGLLQDLADDVARLQKAMDEETPLAA
ncbi:MAG TPA: helix-turn-helix transcriptional regulator [Kiloniellaceae bacterium]|nr:helix-turn-helix transcriptional regulator [Kiloniellaceae bacterium]